MQINPDYDTIMPQDAGCQIGENASENRIKYPFGGRRFVGHVKYF
jgi:hypothetical protein